MRMDVKMYRSDARRMMVIKERFGENRHCLYVEDQREKSRGIIQDNYIYALFYHITILFNSAIDSFANAD